MSCLFKGGPADGQTLSLQRAPRLLRVTLRKVGDRTNFDALDQPHDSPFNDEEIVAYVREGEFYRMHVKFVKGSGWQTVATYVLADPQPTTQQMRVLEEWQRWCIAHDPKAKGER